METGCTFCKIKNGEIPSYRIYEDKKVLAFLDINPLNPGHVLLIPKIHEDHAWDLPQDEFSHLFLSAKKIAKTIRESLSADRVFSLVLGYDIPHVHVHLVPRYEWDDHGGALDFKNKATLSKDEMERIRGRLEKALKTL